MALFEGIELIDYGVFSLRRPRNYPQRAALLVRCVQRLLREAQPNTVALVGHDPRRGKQRQQRTDAVQLVRQAMTTAGVSLYAFPLSTIRQAVTADDTAPRYLVAKALCADYPFLKLYLFKKIGWQQRYYASLFDAVACGIACRKVAANGRLSSYAVTP